MLPKLIKTGMVILTAFFICGCGYHFIDTENSPPSGINNICIPIFINKTREPGIETPFTNSLINEFITRKKIDIVASDKADAIVKGIIKSFNLASISYQRNDVVQEYRVTIVMEVTLIRNDNGEIIWKDRNLRETGEYRVDTNVAAAEANKDAAIIDLANKISEEIHNRIFENF